MTPEYVDASDMMQQDTRSEAHKWLYAEMDKRWANEQGAEPFPTLEAIALEVIEENQRLRAQIEQGVPDDWQLVPKEPTPEMWNAVNKLDDQCAAGNYDGKGCSIEQAWDCLLTSAPPAPQQIEQSAVVQQGQIDKETKVMKLMGFIDDLIDADPERAEIFIESVLAKNALRKRLTDKKNHRWAAEAAHNIGETK